MGNQDQITSKILLVDDDPNILTAYVRVLHAQFQLTTAIGGAEGLKKLEDQGPYAVVVSDLRMPGMDGIEFLSHSKEKSPDTVRMLLTGNVDIKAAIEAVNKGCVFRFLSKPCLPSDFSAALHSGIDQYRLITAERELLQNTLNGGIRVLTEILSIVDPESFGRGNTLRDLISTLAHTMGITDSWEIELAAMLAQIGHVTIPPATLAKEKAGQALSEMEKEIISHSPQTGHKLLANIPRLKSVADTVLYQKKLYDGSGFPKNLVAGSEIPIGARLLKVLMDMTEPEFRDLPRSNALQEMKKREGWYDPAVLNAAFLCFASGIEQTGIVERTEVLMPVKDLRVGQILLSDVVASNGTLLIRAGNWISETILERVSNFAKINGVREPIHVEILHQPASNDLSEKQKRG